MHAWVEVNLANIRSLPHTAACCIRGDVYFWHAVAEDDVVAKRYLFILHWDGL